MVKHLYELLANDKCEEALDYLVGELAPDHGIYLQQAVSISNQYYHWKNEKNTQVMNETDAQTAYGKIVSNLNDLIADLYKNNVLGIKENALKITNAPALTTSKIYDASHHANLDIVEWIRNNRAMLSKSLSLKIAEKFELNEDDAYLFKGALSDFLMLLQESLACQEMSKLDRPNFVFNMDKFEVGQISEALNAIVERLPSAPRITDTSMKACLQYIAYFKAQLSSYR